MKLFQKTITIFILGASLAGCTVDPNTGTPVLSKENTGAVVGAAGGAVAGAQFGKGKGRLVGVAIGTLLGASLGKTVGKSLDQSDISYYDNTSQRALETVKTGSTSDWKNPNTGTHGTITPVRTYETSGQYCREYTQTIHIDGRTEEGYGKACRQEDGSWRIVQ